MKLCFFFCAMWKEHQWLSNGTVEELCLIAFRHNWHEPKYAQELNKNKSCHCACAMHAIAEKHACRMVFICRTHHRSLLESHQKNWARSWSEHLRCRHIRHLMMMQKFLWNCLRSHCSSIQSEQNVLSRCGAKRRVFRSSARFKWSRANSSCPICL